MFVPPWRSLKNVNYRSVPVQRKRACHSIMVDGSLSGLKDGRSWITLKPQVLAIGGRLSARLTTSSRRDERLLRVGSPFFLKCFVNGFLYFISNRVILHKTLIKIRIGRILARYFLIRSSSACTVSSRNGSVFSSCRQQAVLLSYPGPGRKRSSGSAPFRSRLDR